MSPSNSSRKEPSTEDGASPHGLPAAQERAVARGENTIPFPYSAYPQQQQLMQRIFSTIAECKSGCFESPTGTGKSLSIICAALHWQRLQEAALLESIENECSEVEKREKNCNSSSSSSGAAGSSSRSGTAASRGGDDWLADMLASGSPEEESAAKKETSAKRKALQRLARMHARVDKTRTVDTTNRASVEEYLSGARASGFRSGGGGSIFGTAAPADSSGQVNKGRLALSTGAGEDEEFVLEHYESDDEAKKKLAASSRATDVEALLNDPFGVDSADDSAGAGGGEAGKAVPSSADDEDKNSFQVALSLPQIFYCSRTHSQIAQFVTEIHKTDFGSTARCITLGSRKNMCINPNVNKLASDVKISDRCLDMQKSSSNAKETATATVTAAGSESNASATVMVGTKKQRVKKAAKLTACQYKTKKIEEAFADFAMGKVRDIEELVQLGKSLKACPYYATRRAVKLAQVVCMPYSVLLHADTRKSMGISLRNAVVIFDEAHNVVEAVNHLHSADMNSTHLDVASTAIASYLKRFQLSLNGRNLYYVTLLSAVIKKLQNVVKIFLRHRERAMSAAAAAAAASAAASASSTGTDGSKCKSTGAGYNHASSGGSNGGGTNTNVNPNMELMSCNDFIFRAKLDNVNLFKLKRHITETNLVNKIGGYAESVAKRAAAAAAAAEAEAAGRHKSNSNISSSCGNCISPLIKTKTSANPALKGAGFAPFGDDSSNFSVHTHALRGLLNMMACLTNADADGRVVLEMCQASTPAPVTSTATGSKADADDNANLEMHLKFILLNPAVHFRSIINEARSVLLVGGTLQPFNYVTSSLFFQSRVMPKQVQLFSCGHVVDRTNITAIAVSCGPNGRPLEFTHKARSLKATTDELFYSLYQTARAAPKGMVVFFTSYAYMTQLLTCWAGDGKLAELSRTKRCFSEPRTVQESESVWEEYVAVIKTGKGALLCCVMGGKLSEGINFSDDLARCVVVVGLPYPDGRDLVLQEKMRRADKQELDIAAMERGYTNTAATAATATANRPPVLNSSAGKKLYEAMCMKSVNQSIGRSIRHANDYATIVLLDRRFTRDNVIAQLPAWIGRSVVRPPHFSAVLEDLHQFYRKKAQQQRAGES